MSVVELLPTLKELSRADKLRVMQLLVQELAQEEILLQAGQPYDVWSPYDAHDAARTLLGALEGERSTDAGR